MADAVGAGASSRRGVGAAQPHKIPVNPAMAKKSTPRGEQNREVDDIGGGRDEAQRGDPPRRRVSLPLERRSQRPVNKVKKGLHRFSRFTT